MVTHERIILLALLFTSNLAFANNGLLFIGFGSESLNMGGADIAVARDTTALNTNPAGLANTENNAFDIYGTITFARNVRHKDSIGNDVEVANDKTATAGMGFAKHVHDSNFSWGIGFFVQGGAGNEFENLMTTVGPGQDMSATLGIFKLAPGVAYEFNNKLKVGATLSLVYGTLEQKIFPDISLVAPAPFFGLDVDGLNATALNARIGVQYDASKTLTLAAVYSPKSTLDFENGTLKSNQSALGLGTVTYNDARIEGFALPQEAGLGAAWKLNNERTLLSVELTWLNWSNALNQQTLIATTPDNAAAIPQIQRTSPLNWDDQFVFALGIAHEITSATTLYGGLNIANNPVPPETLTPLFSPAIAQKHITFGFSHKLEDGWKVSGGALYVLPESVKYANPALQPFFGPAMEEQIEYLGFNFMFSRYW